MKSEHIPDITGDPQLPRSASLDEVSLEIKKRLATSNPDMKLIHEGWLRISPIAHKLCVLSEIVSRNTGDFKHYILDIYSVQKRKKGFYFDIDKKFTFYNEHNEIEHLYQFLKSVYEKKLPTDGDYILLPKNVAENNNVSNQDLVTTILENPDSYDSLVKIGGVDFFRLISQAANENGQSVNVLSELIAVLGEKTGEDRIEILNSIRSLNLSKSDLDLLSGRKEGLEVFQNELGHSTGWKEADWQKYFECNTWIFGYGLSYKFLKILNREAHVSNTNVTGNHDVIGDFLLADNCFTVLVELKRPDTPLFEDDVNRSGSWKLSTDLTYAVSQILEQKAVWQIKSQTQQFDKTGALIKQKTFDPKSILIIGHSEQFGGTSQVQQIKAKTFELYRRNLKDIEILTYDELCDRADFIVNDCKT